MGSTSGPSGHRARAGGPGDPRTLYRRTFDAVALVRDHPPRFEDRNKAAVHERLAAGAPPEGTIEVTRWTDAAVPARRPARRPLLTEVPGFFDYGQAAPAGTMHWHLNFAMTDCFGAYGSGLLAQDELQVLEHPALASLREAAYRESFPLLCLEGGRPTPVLVAGVERRGALETGATRARPRGLYGNEFSRARRQDVLAALAVLDPPQRSNLVAIEAPAYGAGRYRRDELEGILATAFSGFRAAVVETRRAAARAGPAPRTVVHTGFWGAGAYGGDRELMALLQLVAAELAEVDEVVFYTARADGAEALAAAAGEYDALPGSAPVADVVTRVLTRGYAWGESNGT